MFEDRLVRVERLRSASGFCQCLQTLFDIRTQLRRIDGLYRDLPSQPAFQAFGRRVLQPLLAKTGWTTQPGEGQNTTLLRAFLLETLGELDDPAVVAEAQRRFAIFVKDPTSLSADLRDTVLRIVARRADSATWEQLHSLAKDAKNTVEKLEYFTLLGATNDRDLANRALTLALSDEVAVTTRPAMISSVSNLYPQLAFDFTLAHLDAVMAFLETDSRNQFVPDLVKGAYDVALVEKLNAYAAAHIPANAQQAAVKSRAAIEYNASVRAKRLPEITLWLNIQGGRETLAK